MARKKAQSNFMDQEIKRQQFLAQGLSERQAQSLLSKCSDGVLALLLGLTNAEWQQLRALYDIDDLIRRSEACAHVSALITVGSQLKNLGYGPQQLLAIAQYKNGEKNLKTVLYTHHLLEQHGFQKFQIAYLASNANGHEMLMFCASVVQDWLSLGYSLSQFVAAGAHRTGRRNVEALMLFHADLSGHGFAHDQLIRLAACNEGDVNLQALSDFLPTLARIPLSHDELLRMTTLPGGHRNLRVLMENQDFFATIQISASQIAQLLGRQQGVDFFELMKKYATTMQTYAVSIDQFILLITIVKYVHDATCVLDALPDLFSFALTIQDLLEVLRKGGTTKEIREFLLYKEFFTSVKPPKSQIKSMLMGKESIDVYIRNYSPTNEPQEPTEVTATPETTQSQASVVRSPTPAPVLTPEKVVMLNVGFTITQVHRLAQEPQFFSIVHFLQRELSKPLSILIRFYSFEQITSVAVKTQWQPCFDHLLQHSEVLFTNGFLPTDILALLEGEGPKRNFALVLNHFHHLSQIFQLTAAQIAKTLQTADGASQYTRQLHEAGVVTALPTEQANAAITSQTQPVLKPMGTYLTEHACIITLRSFGFEPSLTQRLLQRPNGRNNAEDLIAVLSASTYLFRFYQPKDLVNASCQYGYRENLQALMQYTQPLLAYGFTPNQILGMASRQGGAQTLAAVLEHYPQLTGALRLTLGDIVVLACHEGGSHNLTAYKELAPVLQLHGFERLQLMKITAHASGAAFLSFIAGQLDVLAARHVTPSEVVLIIGRCEELQTLERFIYYYPLLRQLGFSIKQTSGVIAHDNCHELCEIIERLTCYFHHRYITPCKVMAYLATERNGQEFEMFILQSVFKPQTTNPAPALTTSGWSLFPTESLTSPTEISDELYAGSELGFTN